MDEILVREVCLFADNDQRLYTILTTTYLDNLKKKAVKGVYNKEMSYKLLEYYYSNYIRPAMKNPRTGYGYDPKLNPQERKAVGKYFADYLYDEFLKDIIKNRPTKAKPKVKATIKAKIKKRNA